MGGKDRFKAKVVDSYQENKSKEARWNHHYEKSCANEAGYERILFSLEAS